MILIFQIFINGYFAYWFIIYLLFIGIRGSQTTIKNLYPKEIDSLFIELRHLMEKIKAHYANLTILIIVESVLLLVSGLTKLTINYTRNFEITFSYNLLFSIYNILKFIFLIFMVKEAHDTIEEASIYFSIFLNV